MKTVFKIAGIEIKQLFYSPIAWFLLIVFFAQCSFAYCEIIDLYARRQERGGTDAQSLENLTFWIFASGPALFPGVMQNLFLYIPLLTMGLISRETHSGTIKLLYSSPVSVRQIIFGKYICMMIYSLCMLAVIVVLMIVATFNIQAIDTGQLLSALLGFYLLLCAYSAIGLFMSCLTTYQVLAGVGTFVMIGFLSYVGNLWQRYDFVRDITYFLSLRGRTEHMLSGLISTKDLMYFILIIYIFLGISIVKLKAARESKPALVIAGRYMLVVVSALSIGYITSRPRLVGYCDTTAIRRETLTPKVRELVKQLGNDKLEITVYNNLMGGYYFTVIPEKRNQFLKMWESYIRFKPDISFKYVNYYDSSYDNSFGSFSAPGEKSKPLAERAAQLAKNYDYTLADYKSPEEIRREIDLRPELTRLVMLLKYKGRSTFLRVYNDIDIFPSEQEVGAALQRLLLTKFPKIVFQTGNFERSAFKAGDRDYLRLTSDKTFRMSFVNQGFDVDSLSINNQEIPADVSTLVIADPRQALSAAAVTRIKQYIERGGNLLIAGEPGKQDVLNPLLRSLGVQMMPGIIAEPSADYAPDLVRADVTAAAAQMSKKLALKYKQHSDVLMPGVTGLQYTTDSGFNVMPLLVTNTERSWLKKGKLVTDSAAVRFSAAEGDERKSVATAIALTRKWKGKEQHIVVTGDADFLSNGVAYMYTPTSVNFVFNMGLFSWLSGGQFPIEAVLPESKDKRLNVTADGVKSLRIVLVWVIPGLLLITGSILLIRRKRK